MSRAIASIVGGGDATVMSAVLDDADGAAMRCNMRGRRVRPSIPVKSRTVEGLRLTTEGEGTSSRARAVIKKPLFLRTPLSLWLDRSGKRRSARNRGSVIEDYAYKIFSSASVTHTLARVHAFRLGFPRVTQPLVVDKAARRRGAMRL